MNKHFSIKRTFVSCLAVASLLISCSTDDLVNIGVDDPAIEQNGIAATVFDGIYTLNVKSNGNWKVSLPEDCDWATVLNESGNGNAAIKIVVDGNYTGIDRMTNLTLSTDDETKTIALNQVANIEGATDANDAEFIKVAGNKYLGFGCNLMEFYDNTKKLSFTRNSAINCAAIDTLMKLDENKYYTLATTNYYPSITYDDVELDSVINKQDKLGISIDIQVAYGLMKFGLSGSYHGKEDFHGKTFAIKTGSNYTALNSSVGFLDILATYDNWKSDKVKGKATEDDFRKVLLSPNFTKLQDSLKKVCNDSLATTEKKDNIIRSIINNYGTGVVAETNLGGLFAMDINVDSVYVKEEYNLDSAKITADIKAGLFNLKANLKAEYLNSATTAFKNSNYKLTMQGGDSKLMLNVVNMINKQQFGEGLSKALNEWAQSIAIYSAPKDARKNNAVILSAEAEPIWELFLDEKSSLAIQDYLKRKYPKSQFVQDFIGL